MLGLELPVAVDGVDHERRVEEHPEAKLEETLVAVRTRLGEAAFAEAWEQGRTLTLDEALALAPG